MTKKKDVLANIKGVHPNTKLFFSPRTLVLPYVEIRTAKQEDNDDLAEVFDKQSEMHTGVHGKVIIMSVNIVHN